MSFKKRAEELKKEYYKQVEKFTPNEIKNKPIFDISNPDEIEFILTKEIIKKFDLERWLANYKKEAAVSTGGIRGPQNILYHWDTRFPINQLGVALATIGKALVLKEDIKNREINKIASGEVRYNTSQYIELISRIQANLGIHTHLPFERKTTPIWMASFLIFMLDYDGGEYVTSSHAISSKIATKDINNEGSQFMPEMSLRFVSKIEDIIKKAKNTEYKIKLSKRNHNLISEDFDGYDAYVDYLKKNVARETNLKLIKEEINNNFKLMYDVVGGCTYKTMVPILKKLEILEAFEWRNKEEDPFFHGIGKIWKKNPHTGKKEFFDLSCDFTLIDVVKTAGFEEDLKDKPIGYVVLITDPDGDRLVMGQVESVDRIKILKNLGANYLKINNEKVFAIYHPTYTFLLIMDYYMKILKQEKVLENHPWFIITTAPSSKSWNEWAQNNNIKVITTPVGIKEIANVINKIEKQILANPEKDVVIEDIFENKINLGKNPRMIFGGEESGGMITGLEDFIKSKKGRKALAMRDKSAGEASIIATALAAYLFKNKKLISEHLDEIFRENKIINIYYVRDDIIYYNESEPNPEIMKKEKSAGEIKRDKLDGFYLSIVLALKDKKININQVRKVLSNVIPDLDFSRLIDLKFAGDGTYFQFDNNLFVEIRRSGTDAKMKGYAGGPKKEECTAYLHKLLNYSGERKSLYKKIIPKKYQGDIYPITQKLYMNYLYK